MMALEQGKNISLEKIQQLINFESKEDIVYFFGVYIIKFESSILFVWVPFLARKSLCSKFLHKKQ